MRGFTRPDLLKFTVPQEEVRLMCKSGCSIRKGLPRSRAGFSRKWHPTTGRAGRLEDLSFVCLSPGLHVIQFPQNGNSLQPPWAPSAAERAPWDRPEPPGLRSRGRCSRQTPRRGPASFPAASRARRGSPGASFPAEDDQSIARVCDPNPGRALRPQALAATPPRAAFRGGAGACRPNRAGSSQLPTNRTVV